MGGAKHQIEKDTAPSGWLSAADYNEAVRDKNEALYCEYIKRDKDVFKQTTQSGLEDEYIKGETEPYETIEDMKLKDFCKKNQVKDDLYKVNRNYMKKWSKEDDEKLTKMLDDCVEQEKKFKYDNDLRLEFGRTFNSITSRLKKLIYEGYDEESWEDCRIAIGLNQYTWKQFLDSQKKKDAEKETNKDIMAHLELNRIKKIIDGYNYKFGSVLRLTYMNNPIS